MDLHLWDMWWLGAWRVRIGWSGKHTKHFESWEVHPPHHNHKVVHRNVATIWIMGVGYPTNFLHLQGTGAQQSFPHVWKGIGFPMIFFTTRGWGGGGATPDCMHMMGIPLICSTFVLIQNNYKCYKCFGYYPNMFYRGIFKQMSIRKSISKSITHIPMWGELCKTITLYWDPPKPAL